MKTLYFIQFGRTIRTTTDRKLAAEYMRTLREFAAQQPTTRWYTDRSTRKFISYQEAAPEQVKVSLSHIREEQDVRIEPRYKIVQKCWDGSYEVTLVPSAYALEMAYRELCYDDTFIVSRKFNKRNKMTTIFLEDNLLPIRHYFQDVLENSLVSAMNYAVIPF